MMNKFSFSLSLSHSLPLSLSLSLSLSFSLSVFGLTRKRRDKGSEKSQAVKQNRPSCEPWKKWECAVKIVTSAIAMVWQSMVVGRLVMISNGGGGVDVDGQEVKSCCWWKASLFWYWLSLSTDKIRSKPHNEYERKRERDKRGNRIREGQTHSRNSWKSSNSLQTNRTLGACVCLDHFYKLILFKM